MSIKVLFVSYAPPLPSWGGSMTFFRHFIEREDFTTMVVTNSPLVNEYDLPYTPFLISEPKWWKRISRTRFLPIIYGLECLQGQKLISKEVFTAAKDFNPDVVFTVGGSWHWTALGAKKIADELDVPLVASFNDWFDYGWFPAHKALHRTIERKYRKFYQQADLAVCTSEGMKEELGEHQNAHVLYPTGAVMPKELDDYIPLTGRESMPFTVFFGGGLGDWYGKMLEDLILTCKKEDPSIQFAIFGSMPSWSTEFDIWAKEEGIFGGRVTFDQLRKEAAMADLLLLPMGFDKDSAIVERTSFKTKFLDYLTFNRPILVWGPEYCSAVRTAKEFDSAECVESRDASWCANSIKNLSKDPERLQELNNNARNMYNSRFHPNTIHRGLVNKITETISNYKN